MKNKAQTGLIIFMVMFALIVIVIIFIDYKTPINVNVIKYNQTTNQTYNTSSTDYLPLWIILFAGTTGSYNSGTNTLSEDETSESSTSIDESSSSDTSDSSFSDSGASDSGGFSGGEGE